EHFGKMVKDSRAEPLRFPAQSAGPRGVECDRLATGVDETEMDMDAVADAVGGRLGREGRHPAEGPRHFPRDLADGDGPIRRRQRVAGLVRNLELILSI